MKLSVFPTNASAPATTAAASSGPYSAPTTTSVARNRHRSGPSTACRDPSYDVPTTTGRAANFAPIADPHWVTHSHADDRSHGRLLAPRSYVLAGANRRTRARAASSREHADVSALLGVCAGLDQATVSVPGCADEADVEVLRLALDVARADVLVRHHARGGVEGGEEHRGRTDVVESTARANIDALGLTMNLSAAPHEHGDGLAASPDAGLYASSRASGFAPPCRARSRARTDSDDSRCRSTCRAPGGSPWSSPCSRWRDRCKTCPPLRNFLVEIVPVVLDVLDARRATRPRRAFTKVSIPSSAGTTSSSMTMRSFESARRARYGLLEISPSVPTATLRAVCAPAGIGAGLTRSSTSGRPRGPAALNMAAASAHQWVSIRSDFTPSRRSKRVRSTIPRATRAAEDVSACGLASTSKAVRRDNLATSGGGRRSASGAG